MTSFGIFVLLAILFVVSANSNKYTASFGDGGLFGHFQISYIGGQASYSWNFDFSGLNTTCDLSTGVDFHIHSFWTDPAFSSVSTCDSTGGHYDPYLACGPSSQDKSEKCALLGRTSEKGYTYECNPDNYSLGHYSLCELGDFSGKFGRLIPDSSLQVIGGAVDPNPPIEANWNEEDDVSRSWASLVLHCPATKARLACALVYRQKCLAKKGMMGEEYEHCEEKELKQ